MVEASSRTWEKRMEGGFAPLRWGMMGKGNHKGCPYGGVDGVWSSNRFVSMGGRFPNRPYGQSRRWGIGEGQPQGLPLRGGGWGVVGESVWAGGSRTAPTAQSRRWGMMGKGNHKGCPYGGVDVVVVVERVPVRVGVPVPTVQSRRWGMTGKGNHKGFAPTGDGCWWWSSNGFVSMGGRFPNRPYGAGWG